MSIKAHTFEQGLANLLVEAHRHGFSVQSDYARRHADYVAMGASMGLISTHVVANIYARDWRPTTAGLLFLQALDIDGLDD